MNFVRRSLEPLVKFLQELPPSQRLSLVTIVAIVAAGLGYLVYRGAVPDEATLLAGKRFSTEELKTAQEVLKAGGMTDYRVDGMQIYVSRSRAGAYDAALIAGNGLPAEFATELGSLHKSLNPFVGNAQRQEMIEIARARDLCGMIKQIPDVADARLVMKENKERGLYGATRTTATLSVRPKSGRSISSQLAHSLRRAVASGFNMSADDVTVLDTSGKVVTGPESKDGYDSDFLDRKQEFADHFQKTIEHALSRIPHTIVAVNVELDTLKTSRERKMQSAKPFPTKTREEEESDESTQSQSSRQPGVRPNMPANVAQGGGGQNDHRKKKSVNTGDNIPGEQTYMEKDYEGLPLKSVQATVSIPEDYFKQVAMVGAPETDPAKLEAKIKAVREKTLLEVKTTVAKLLPPSPAPGKTEDLVTVTAYERLDANLASVEVSMTTTITELAGQYGGPGALLLVALWALFALQRSLPKIPDPPPMSAAAAAAGGRTPEAGDDDGTALEQKPKRDPSVRDKLQSSVRDNPEMAAAVLERWIKTQRS